MGLHEALSAPVQWKWGWYSAVVERPGRLHLLRVPIVKRLTIHAPTWYYSAAHINQYIENERRRGEVFMYPGYVYDSSVRPGNITRHCTTLQNVTYWDSENPGAWHGDTEFAIRGMCDTCRQFSRSGAPMLVTKPGMQLQRGETTIGRLTALEEDDTSNIEYFIKYSQGDR